MDNFKRPKKRPNSSIDGFVSGKYINARGGSDLRSFDRYYKPRHPQESPIAPRQVDSFSRVDGFTPAILPAIEQPSALQKPSEIGMTFQDPHRTHESQRPRLEPEHPKKTKKRWFRRNKDLAALKRKRSKKRLVLSISGALAAVVVLTGGGILLRGYLAGRNIFRGGGNSVVLNNENVDPTQLKGEGDGRVNVLLLGKGGSEQSDGPDLTDTIIVASIDPIAKEAALLSIPRDFWVKSSSGYQSKINEVYANAKYAVLDNYPYKDRGSDEAKEKAEKAGIDAIKRTVTETMGIPVHYYGMIDFAGFRKAIDTVGGIEINVTEDMAVKEFLWIGGKNYNLNVTPGVQQFDGMRALAFSRSRKTSARGDFARSDRQRAIILGLKDKVLSTGTLANPIKINQLISDLGDQVSTDFSVNEILRVYDLAKEIPGDKVVSVGLDDYVKGEPINGLSAQIPKAGVFNYSEIQSYVRNIMRDAFLKKENARIVVLNGTQTTGLATKKSTELKSYGYNIVSVGDAPTENYTSTVLVDLRSGENKYTLNYLEKRLNIKAVPTMPDATIDTSNADFIIILGTDSR